jgi:hypothetical protein
MNKVVLKHVRQYLLLIRMPPFTGNTGGASIFLLPPIERMAYELIPHDI